MEAIHVFIKGRNGNGVFYRTEDFLVLISIVGTIAREMGISIIAFCPMFNHVHILVKGIDMETLRALIHKIETTFVREYNHEYNRSGPLFQKSFGRSVKKESKTILGCVAYVFNNPVAGKLCKEAIAFRWNLALAVNMLIVNKINDLTVPKSVPLEESIYSKSSS